jgi:hypothetical protein
MHGFLSEGELSAPDGHPDCLVRNPSWIEDRECNNFQNYNTTECGFDAGDCLGTSIAVVLNTDNQMYHMTVGSLSTCLNF